MTLRGMESWHIVLIVLAVAAVIIVWLLKDRLTKLRLTKKGLRADAASSTPGGMKLKDIAAKENIDLEQTTGGDMHADGAKAGGNFTAKNTQPPK